MTNAAKRPGVPWGRCCLGFTSDHRVSGTAAYQKMAAVESIERAWSMKHWPLPILHGESGSGKTSAMVSCATEKSDVKDGMTSGTVVVMMMTREIVKRVPRMAPAPPPPARDAFDADITEAYADAIAKVALRRMQGLEEGMCPDDYVRAKREVRIVVAIDEASSDEGFVRHLCRTRVGVAEKVEQRLGVREVRIVAGGTGATTAVKAPGSLPMYYRLLHLDPPNLVAALRVKLTSLPRRIFDAVAADELTGGPFMTNPRCAEMVAEVANRLVEDGTEMEWLHTHTVTLMVPAVLAMAAGRFKAKNGCSSFNKMQCSGS